MRIALLLALPALVSAQPPVVGDWNTSGPRVWAGPDFWANRLQDWQVRGGKLECLAAGPNQEARTLHVLTREVLSAPGNLHLSVRTGVLDAGASGGFSGFLLGAGAGKLDYRGSALVHHLSGEGGGFFAVMDMNGALAFRDNSSEKEKNTYPEISAEKTGAPKPRSLWEDVLLELEAAPGAGGRYDLRLSARSFVTGEPLGEAVLHGRPASDLNGNIALVSSGARFWFRDLRIGGTKVATRPERAFGPVAAALHTVSRGVLKMTVQLLPVKPGQGEVALEHRAAPDGEWKSTSAPVLTPGYTAHFRLENWDAARDHDYRIRYSGQIVYTGRIRKDPIGKNEITVAAFTGQQVIARPADDSWGATGYAAPRGRWTPQNVWFPHREITAGVAAQQPDLLFFSGDQIYESGNPTGRDHEGRFPELDFLYRWYLWCWSLGRLAQDTPAVLLLDDHDIYHGNIWGMGGRRNTSGDDQDGGYLYDPEFVQLAERVQAWHLPDAYDRVQPETGIGSYFTGFTYGGIGFAAIEDRKFKSPPVALKNLRPGVLKDGKIIDPAFDIAAATGAELDLLGKKQMEFLRAWTQDWQGAKFKVLLSQTAFASVQTDSDGKMIADLDSDGWPMPARNTAVDLLRRGHVFGIAGDTHLSFVVQHGVERHRDGFFQFCVPAVANKYRRWFEPAIPGRNRRPDAPAYTGDHEDAFGNRITVLAVGNSRVTPRDILASGNVTGDPRPAVGAAGRSGYFTRQEVSYAGVVDYHTVLGRDINADGYGIVRFDKARQTIHMENWPWNAVPGSGDAGQYAGWPITITLAECDGRKPAAWLPDLNIQGRPDPVVQVIARDSGEVIYTTRAKDGFFRPAVFRPGVYTLRVGEPGGEFAVFDGLEATSEPGRSIQVVIR